MTARYSIQAPSGHFRDPPGEAPDLRPGELGLHKGVTAQGAWIHETIRGNVCGQAPGPFVLWG